ncbi:vWA domain-containing protein [Nocardiopsis lambiniae]|uniref:VWA domain-containing protein n=1 Tax=Nocardiopsis lambiniae TaxID=3075539 RepID=A0ABU2M2S0_9ACTN|nr:VWA domain-containing protein [Nocardiopsis sp. DSM 44743]MDT0326863.1 VWA domain-containing protein [Nocardiopsis sp. DSM 44743]
MSQQILPFYLVCDESTSMDGEPIQAINEALPDLHAKIGANPVVSDKVHFAIIAFNHEAQVLLPLADLSEVESLPALQATGGTSYGEAFTLLRETIAQDVDRLKGEGHRVYRPAVFFLSDGFPGDGDWDIAYKKLIDPGWGPHPNILAFGFGEADPRVIRQVATAQAFMSDGTLNPGQALQEFAKSLTNSIVTSGTRAASSPDGAVTLDIPDHVPGYTSLPADQI